MTEHVPPGRLQPDVVDGLLMDVAQRIQLSRTKHDEAERHYRALCAHVDRPGSPLEGRVVECYPSGSFATGTAIASSVSQDQHDVDVVIELDIPPWSDPKWVLTTLFEAINGEVGSRYHGRVKLNSRCATIHYEDGTTVDFMPVARLPHLGERVGNLFHFKREAAESFHKGVNPWGFAKHFNAHVEVMEAFAKAFAERRLLNERVVAKADAQPMPDHVPLEEKSPRVVALQLLKRHRDLAYRRRPGFRKPPSVVLSAMSLDVGPVSFSLAEELHRIQRHLSVQLAIHPKLSVFNPAYTPDEFTDRWPESPSAQDLYAADLKVLGQALERLRTRTLSFEEMQQILESLFGETAATYAIEKRLDESRLQAAAGDLKFGPRGRIITGAAVASGVATSARGSTFLGGPGWPK